MNARNRIRAASTLVALAVTTLALTIAPAGAAPLVGELGILDVTANDGLNPATGAAWAEGDLYRLVFVTSTRRDATETDIGVYNQFVQDAAAASPLGLGAATWKVIGSSETVDAKTNTSTDPAVHGTGEAIFLVDGVTLVETDYAALWGGDSALVNGIGIDEMGDTVTGSQVHTGTNWDGTQAPIRYFGTAIPDGEHLRAEIGLSANATWRWIRQYNTSPTTELPFYALSDPMTVLSAFDPTDFDQDDDSDIDDIDALTAAADLATGLPAALAGEQFDLTGDETVDGADLDKWLADAATINGFGSPYLKGDANVDGDVDVWAFDGSGDAQVLSSNLGTMSGMVWSDGDFNGDGDVDVWAFDGSGDAQHLSSNLGSTSDVGPDAAAGTAEALYYQATGELAFDIGTGVGVVGIMADGMMHGAVNEGSIFGTPGQNGNNILAYFNTAGLPTGEDSVGIVLPSGLTEADLSFSYTPVGGATTVVPVTIIPVPEPSTIAMLMVVGLIGVCWRRRRG